MRAGSGQRRARAALIGLALALLGTAAFMWFHRAGPDERIAYKQWQGQPLHLDLFRAKGAAQRAPGAALVLFHGGGWAHGSPAQFHPQCRHFSRMGLHCISVEYRVRLRHGSTPADALQDARDAMRHLRRQAQALGLDPRRIAAGGGSAGGHLAAALGVGLPWPDPGHDPAWPVRPDALVLLNPVVDLSPGTPDHAPAGDAWASLSPLHHVGPGTPPTLILHGSADTEVAPDSVRRYCTAAREAGGDCEVVWFEGAGHGFFNPGAEGGRHHDRANAEIERFLRQQGLL